VGEAFPVEARAASFWLAGNGHPAPPPASPRPPVDPRSAPSDSCERTRIIIERAAREGPETLVGEGDWAG
jgi:hypothetical protein